MGPAALLVSDVDHTLLGNDEATTHFAQWYQSARSRVRLAYNSGRFFNSIEESIETTPLPMPDAIIGGVGTDIRFASTGECLDGWPSARDWEPARIHMLLSGFPELQRQPGHLQSDYKVSYYGHDLPPGFLDELRLELRRLGQRADLVYSSHRDLDVLPAGINKGTATARLADHWQIPAQQVIVAGDSGNDLAMFVLGFRGIVVGNAHPDLQLLEGEDIYHASEEFAAGVLEGVRYWLSNGSGV